MAAALRHLTPIQDLCDWGGGIILRGGGMTGRKYGYRALIKHPREGRRGNEVTGWVGQLDGWRMGGWPPSQGLELLGERGRRRREGEVAARISSRLAVTHQDDVSIHDRAQPVCDNDRCTPASELREGGLDLLLSQAVQCTCCLCGGEKCGRSV